MAVHRWNVQRVPSVQEEVPVTPGHLPSGHPTQRAGPDVQRDVSAGQDCDEYQESGDNDVAWSTLGAFYDVPLAFVKVLMQENQAFSVIRKDNDERTMEYYVLL